MEVASVIVGSSPTKKRNKLDFYPTPREVTIALLDFLHIPENAKIWEPACGDGRMVEVMRERGYDVTGTDIQSGVDFLTADLPKGCEWIITNPPFNVSEKFIKRCIYHGKPFALLLKSQYWHAAKRSPLFMEHPPKFVLPLTWRPDFTGQGSSLLDMAWCVWGDNYGLTFSLYKPLLKPTEN
jgi:hypothetical protein